MSSKQRHRGQHSNDPLLFNDKWLPIINQAVVDHSWLLSRGYSDKSSLSLVGDRYKLNARQRQAVYRASCSDASRAHRQQHEQTVDTLNGQPILIDGYNLLITIEAALSGGIIIECRDGCLRDIASVHGTYRKVEETIPALESIGTALHSLGKYSAKWLLDRPVSNSGRLKEIMLTLAREKGFDWQVDLTNSPDKTIVNDTDHLAISSDGWVLDHVSHWFNLPRYIIDQFSTVNLISLNGA